MISVENQEELLLLADRFLLYNEQQKTILGEIWINESMSAFNLNKCK
jgi:hypothetical protein